LIIQEDNYNYDVRNLKLLFIIYSQLGVKNMQGIPLEGLKVLDMTTSTFNYAGKLLAGFGADVVKVEPPDGDPIRYQPPFVNDQVDPELSGRHLHMNTGKRSIVLDLDIHSDVEKIKDLVKSFDILIESYSPGYMESLGLGYEQLNAIQPELIMASITYFGQDGPYADYEGSELVADALSGYLYLTGDSDKEPVKCFDNLIEQQSSLQAAVAIMTAVTARELQGGGDYLDISATEAALFLLGGPAQMYHWTDRIAGRVGTRLMNSAPQMFYPSCIRPCKDGYVHVHSNTRYVDLLGILMEQPRLNEPEILETPMGHADEIDEIMSRWLMKHDKFEVVRMAQEMRLPFTEVFTPEEIVNDDHLNERNFFVEVDHPLAGTVKQPGAPGMMTGTPWETKRAPLLGEHQDEVLGNQ